MISVFKEKMFSILRSITPVVLGLCASRLSHVARLRRARACSIVTPTTLVQIPISAVATV